MPLRRSTATASAPPNCRSRGQTPISTRPSVPSTTFASSRSRRHAGARTTRCDSGCRSRRACRSRSRSAHGRRRSGTRRRPDAAGEAARREALPSPAHGCPVSQASRTGWPRYYTVVLLLFAAVFISYIDRTNISVAAIAMQADLGWTETDKGLVLSSFFVGYLLLMAASGALANRFGGWLVLGIAVLWWSAWTALTPPAALTSLTALVMARIALGLGEAAVFPASINMIGRWVPAERRSRATALLISAIALGAVFSLPITGWLV